MTQVRKARNFARQRRWLTAAIVALTLGMVGALTAAAATGSHHSTSKAGANSLLAAGTTVNGDASCGYSGTTQFTESTVMRWAQVNGTGLSAQFLAYANDENSTLLGVNGASPNTASPDHKANASGGTTTQTDLLGRPYYPALYITPVSGPGSWTKPGDPIPTAAGDWQQGGTPRNVDSNGLNPFVDDVFGTWVTGTQTISSSPAPGQVGTLANGPLSTTLNTTHLDLQSALTKTVFSGDSLVVATTGHTITFVANATASPGATSISVTAKKSNFAYPNGSTITDNTAQTGNYARQATLPAKNDWNLGAGSDAPVGQTFANMGDEGYGTEFRWNANELSDYTGAQLATGQWYKIQVIEHDGDQNKGGDSGEFCTLIKIPGPPDINTDPTGGTNPNNVNANAHIKQWIGTAIKDTAFIPAKAGFGNPTGTVTFKLYFDAGNAPNPAGSCQNASDTPPGTLVYTDTETLDGNNPSVATSGTYSTAGHGFGTYYWHDTFNPGGSNGSNYTTVTEACGVETDQMVDARVRLTPHTAINIVGTPHTLKAYVETTTDGSAFTKVAGAHVTTSLTPAGNHAVYVPAGTSACDTAAQGNPSDTFCSVTINDDTVETVFVNASSTFTATGVSGGVNGDDSITRSTDNSASCSSDNATGATCEAIKHYINPKTELIVSDKLIGLGADATGTVTYTVYPTSADCAAGTNGIDKTPANNTVTGGVAPPSVSINVDPPASGTTTYYFSAHYEGNEGTVTTDCTKETASTG